uniref:Uncharacterized protein n=1 Tax=Onchocerca volvulus TaxID=6282 RepID=A0A8R1TUG2_ONCVO
MNYTATKIDDKYRFNMLKITQKKQKLEIIEKILKKEIPETGIIRNYRFYETWLNTSGVSYLTIFVMTSKLTDFFTTLHLIPVPFDEYQRNTPDLPPLMVNFRLPDLWRTVPREFKN